MKKAVVLSRLFLRTSGSLSSHLKVTHIYVAGRKRFVPNGVVQPTRCDIALLRWHNPNATLPHWR